MKYVFLILAALAVAASARNLKVSYYKVLFNRPTILFSHLPSKSASVSTKTVKHPALNATSLVSSQYERWRIVSRLRIRDQIQINDRLKKASLFNFFKFESPNLVGFLTWVNVGRRLKALYKWMIYLLLQVNNLKAFSYTNCNPADPIALTDFSIQPDPVLIPGTIYYSGSITGSVGVTSPTAVSTSMFYDELTMYFHY